MPTLLQLYLKKKKKQRGKLVTTKLKIKKHCSLWPNYLPRVSSGRERSERSLWLKIRKTSRFYLFVMHPKPKKEALIIASVRFTRSSIENRREEGCVKNLAVTQPLAEKLLVYRPYRHALGSLKRYSQSVWQNTQSKIINRFSDFQIDNVPGSSVHFNHFLELDSVALQISKESMNDNSLGCPISPLSYIFTIARIIWSVNN